MKRLIIWLMTAVVLIGGGYAFYAYQKITGMLVPLTEENIAKLEAETAQQNEKAFAQPAAQKKRVPPSNPNKNLYFGDLHIHTSLSFDGYLFGNRNTLKDAYKFAKGAALTTMAGEKMQLSRPLDFVGITDHAESFGLMNLCLGNAELPEKMADFCSGFDNPSLGFFTKIRSLAEGRPLKVPSFMCESFGEGDCARNSLEAGRPIWDMIRATAEEENEPGVFTAFAAYEYSPPLSERGKHHRNIFFRNSNTTSYAYSAYDARTAPILWKMLEEDCTGDCEFITIPHNPNKSWGLTFAQTTIDGDAYTDEDWQRRIKYEPLVEMFQIKGASECAVGVNTTDEECSFEQFFPPCLDGETTGCIHQTSMIRDGLKAGLQMEAEKGINPFKVGMVGSTDTHNSAAGDAEEYDYRGASGIFSSPASKRMFDDGDLSKTRIARNPGGLAAVWAPENTRDAIFDALKAKETYATSGTRIGLRFFAGTRLDQDILSTEDPISAAYDGGVPMGQTLLTGANNKPNFMVIATMDPMTVPLDRVQIIKGWVQDGKSHERVYDVACSDDRVPNDAGMCPDLVAEVDLSNCEPATNMGDAKLSSVWSDPDYDPEVSAFYYVRVLEIPTCRWSSYDALRLSRSPLDGWPTAQRERAWSSPIWVKGS